MEHIKSTRVTRESELWQQHRMLAQFNHDRLTPRIPSMNIHRELEEQYRYHTLEIRVLERERALVQMQALTAPSEKKAFLQWFENLKETGPGQNSSLFPWLAESATYDQMRWFIRQEVAGEAGFEDLTAITQVKIPTRPKLEMARNYWDEMGRGREPGMHGPMLAKIADEFDLENYDVEVVPEAVALGNVMLGMAMHRQYAYHSIGALGVIELTAPGRALKVYEGLKRLGISREGQRYYHLHSTLDIKHSEEWNREVLEPLLDSSPAVARAIAEGALMRLNAGARCFERYKRHFGFEM